VPGQFDRPGGCLFSPRCHFATLRCRDEEPKQRGAEAGFALCHYPLVKGEPTGHPGPVAEAVTA
jgi:dipeptide transport system ATP-binding protein